VDDSEVLRVVPVDRMVSTGPTVWAESEQKG
jgi:hypothetical protein